MKSAHFTALLILAVLVGDLTEIATGADGNDPPPDLTGGRFWRLHWYERDHPELPPPVTRRLRINSPEVVLHPEYGKRPEARENGLMLIRAGEDLDRITAAELHAEMWGGHPGTANKRFTVNGRTTHWLPRVGTEAGHCVYFHPVTPLKITDLVNGLNAIQYAVDQGTTFWGHAMIDEACLRVALTNSHPDLVRAGLDDFRARVAVASRDDGGEGLRLRLEGAQPHENRISRVVYQAHFFGYDENGDGLPIDWHGFTRKRRPEAMAGSASRAPFEAEWDTFLLPAQKEVALRAWVTFKNLPDLVYMTPGIAGRDISERASADVRLIHSHDLPDPFWSRDHHLESCHLHLDMDPARIEQAELHVVAWTGGSGTVRDYFTLNGHPFPVAEGTAHEPVYTRLPVPPGILRHGLNRIELLSDTEHHGIEICLPGPALMIRYRKLPPL